ncbi:MAG: ATPase, T2SS/T4P/T4SS family [Gemmatimonadota bacterium]|nr:ATPase, T2SS/T4P/T4SS family [Gemmatimonadota bacterium]MDH3423766.1 ATPase, T2SS/T4P/T4SS family [Gemmatimonadota bacterium]
MSESSPNHWLKDVAAHAGLDIALPRRPDIATLRQAWPAVAKACKLPDAAFTKKVAGYFRIGVADVGTYDPQAVKLIPESVARRYGVLPLSSTGDSLVIATSDPANRAAHRDIVAHSSRDPVFMMASPAVLGPALERAYAPARAPRNALQTLVAQVADTDFQVVTNQGQGLFTSFELEDPAVVKLADIVLKQGVRYRATEVHIEPGAEAGRVRYRIDGVLQHVVDLPPTAHDRLVARLKHLALGQPGINPEDGFEVTVSPELSRRAHLLSTPTPDGELVSIRLFDPHSVPTIDDLGFSGLEARKIEQVLSRKEGLVLVTGPARSGTTSFIYAALASLRHESVISLEGRPELVVPGVTQIRYDASKGLSFAETLQHLLDRSPDVIHAGEIRDLPTARIALRTAVTGRKVLATVHTSDAVSGIRRLVDMGLAPGRLGESLHAVVSLRLVRRLCEKCARPYDPGRDDKSREAKLASVLGVSPVKRAVGCKSCAGTGYRNQIPIPEVLVITPEMKTALGRNPNDAELLRAAQADGMRTFAEVGLERVAKGETTVEELERVLGVVPVRDEAADEVGPVLIADDSAEDRAIVASILSGMGFEVVEAPGGQSAKTMVEAGDDAYSLVLLDLYMDDLGGKDVLRAIRQRLTTQALPVIILTSSANPRDEFELLEAGADDFLIKPVVPERLEARVRAVLRRGGVRVK